MEANKEQQKLIELQVQEERIEIKGKRLQKNFIVSMPTSSKDYEILSEILSPEFLTNELEEQGGKDYVGGICYGLSKYDTIMKEFLKSKNQSKLIDGGSAAFMMEYLNKTKLRLIEPESEELRIVRKNTPFLHLDKVPQYLADYLRNRKETDNMDALHYTFWENLFNEDNSKKKLIAHYISWVYEREISERKGDIFIPSVPYIKRNLTPKIKNDLLFFTQEINRISYNLYGEESALYFVIDADLFIDGNAIQQINTMILSAPNRYIFFKILNIDKVLGKSGYYAKKNLEEFLVTLLNSREIGQEKVIGMLNGGGFSNHERTVCVVKVKKPFVSC